MAFELDDLTKVKVLDIRVLAQKNRGPDDPPGAQMLLQSELPADALSMFDGHLKGQMFRKANAKQSTLDGIEAIEKTTFSEHVQRIKWFYEQTGCEVVIDRGMGGRSNIPLSDCKVHRVSISPREASIVVQWTVDAPGLSDATWSKLPALKAQEVEMTMHAPSVSDDEPQADIEPDQQKPKSRVRKAAADAHPTH